MVIHGLSYNIGDMVKYYCRPGLAAMTPQMITCQSDGQWNHTPLCKGMFDTILHPFSTLLVMPECPCPFFLKQGISANPLIISAECLTN